MFGAGTSHNAGSMYVGFTGQADIACSTKVYAGGWVLFLSYLSGVASSAIDWPILRFAATAAAADELLER